MAASALCIRPADCLGAKPFFGAHRGVRAAPAPRRSVPQPQQYVRVPTTASASVPGPSRPARGRANGRQRGRRSPRAAGSPTEKRVMENVVILKRGETKVTAALELAAVPPPASKSGAQAEKGEPVAAAANQRGAQAEEKAALFAAADKHASRAVKAGAVAGEDRHSAQADEGGGEPAAAAKQSSAKVVDVRPVAAADTQAKKAEAAEQQQRGAAGATNAGAKAKVAKQQKGTKAGAAAPPALYSGPPFAAAPQPRELPIPFLLLNGRGARLRPRDAERAAPTAAAA